MPRTGLTKKEVIEKAAELANSKGLSYVTVTTLSEYLGIKKPSLYYHFSSLEEVTEAVMIYGWTIASEKLTAVSECEDAQQALKSYAREFYKFAVENPGVFEAMLWYNKYISQELVEATEGLYKFFFGQMEKLGVENTVASHLLRTYRAFLEGFIMLVIHNSFGNPISINESFEISLEVLINGMDKYR